MIGIGTCLPSPFHINLPHRTVEAIQTSPVALLCKLQTAEKKSMIRTVIPKSLWLTLFLPLKLDTLLSSGTYYLMSVSRSTSQVGV